MDTEAKTHLSSISFAHWFYVKGILEASEVSERTISLINYHYTTAFTHGFKHGIEFAEQNGWERSDVPTEDNNACLTDTLLKASSLHPGSYINTTEE